MATLLQTLASYSVFILALSPPATAGSESVLSSFGSSGANPLGPLVRTGGLFFGVTAQGGGSAACYAGCGTVFSATKGGIVTTLHAFQGGQDGAEPNGGLVELGGTLYGTTFESGNSGCYAGRGCGTVFSITPAGVETTIYSFKGGADGGTPFGRLLAVNGVLYGTTYVGGSSNAGTVFSITPGGAERVIYSFRGGHDGSFPNGALTSESGTFYGTTFYGGGKGCADDYGCGTVFSITPSGSEHVLHRFNGAGDGTNPYGGLLSVGRLLYGTTTSGGDASAGAVFSVSPDGKERILYSFPGGTNADPAGSLLKVGPQMYGYTLSGAGTVFSISRAGLESSVYSFAGGADGSLPSGGLLPVEGALYGVTEYGGTYANGTLFEISP